MNKFIWDESYTRGATQIEAMPPLCLLTPATFSPTKRKIVQEKASKVFIRFGR